ncbi:hypothetical protein [Ruegeria intermedia]|nr:hypothetical protein [Ruegeria intermedia]
MTRASDANGHSASRSIQHPNLSDLGDVRDLLPLRYRPACRAGSAHLMTATELAEAIREIEARMKVKPNAPNIRACLARFHAEQNRRKTETHEDRVWRMKSRLAWEFAQEKIEAAQKRPDSYCAQKPAQRY